MKTKANPILRSALLTNTANEQTVHLALAGHTATIPLPKDSVTTVSWT